jgi:hypothetical protein
MQKPMENAVMPAQAGISGGDVQQLRLALVQNLSTIA